MRFGSLASKVTSENDERSSRLVTTPDGIKRKMGSGTLRLLGEGFGKRWKTKACRLTPCYTTRIEELAVAKTK